MSEPVATVAAPTTAPATTAASTVVDGKASDVTTATNADNEMTERSVPVNDPPVTGASSMQMPPLVVKQRGVSKPGVAPTAGSVSFDYTGPPVKVTNGTVMDLVTQFGIQNAWLAVLKLRGFTVTKERAETILPIKRFRDRVRKLKQTAETLKTRSDDSATFFAKEFVSALNTGTMDSVAPQGSKTASGQKDYSTTDAVIESILREAATEVNGGQSSAPATKPKRKKNNTQKQVTIVTPAGAAGSSHANNTIDDVVSSVMNKIRNNEPFEGEDRNGPIAYTNVELPYPSAIHQQPPQQMVFAPHLQPGQTIFMVQDDNMIPLYQQQQPQMASAPPPVAAAPSAKAAKQPKGKKGKAAAAAAAAAQSSASQIPQQQVVQVPNYLAPQQMAQTIRSPTSTSMPQQVTVLTVPRGQTGANTASYSIPPGYSTAKFDNNTTVIFSNINDLIRAQQSPAVANQPNQMAKVVAYQPGMTLPPGATIMSNANPQGMASPSTGYQQIVTHPPPAQSAQPQYVVQQVPATQPSASPIKPQPQTAATDDKAGDSGKKTPRRKSAKAAKQENAALENFNDSDFEELATSKRKESLKKPKKEKKEKKAPVEKKEKKAPVKPATPKAPAKKTKKRKAEAESEPEEEIDEHIEAESSDTDEHKDQHEREIAQLKRQLQAERSRHYTQKRRATKLDDDYKRVLDRLQQTELNLALQMSECERLQAELKKLTDENETLTAKTEGRETPKTSAAKTNQGRPASKRAAAAKKRPISSSPSPAPGSSQKKGPKAKATPVKTTNNRKRGRPAANSPDTSEPVEEASSSTAAAAPPAASPEDDKPSFNPTDFIPRRAAAAKRIRYF